MRWRIAATSLLIIKTLDDNSKGRVEPEDGLPPLNGIVPLGRIPNGTILHKRRAATRTSMAEAGKCSLVSGSAAAKPRLLARSRTFPMRHPAILPGKANPWALSGGLPCPQRSAPLGPHLGDEELRLPGRARGGTSPSSPRRRLRGGRRDRGDVGQDPGRRRRRDEGQVASRMALGAFSRQGALPTSAP